jgi:hypothetical protein
VYPLKNGEKTNVLNQPSAYGAIAGQHPLLSPLNHPIGCNLTEKNPIGESKVLKV